MTDARTMLGWARSLREDHEAILVNVGSATTRVVTVDSLVEQLPGLSARQQTFLRESISSVEVGSYRSAIVMAWTAVMDRVLEICDADGFSRIIQARPRWSVPKNREDFSEQHAEYQTIEAFRDAGFITKSLAKTLLGQLHTRNQCAHPTSTNPSFNIALGYVEDVINSLNALVGVR